MRKLIQPLDHWENALGEITDITDMQLTSSRSDSVRRSVNVRLVGKSYEPSKNSDFWYLRKFRIILRGEDSTCKMGTFLTLGADSYDNLVNVTASDKFALLDGSAGVGRCTTDFSTDITAGTIYVADLIRETLMRSVSNGMVLDPLPPLIDSFFETAPLYCDLTLSSGQFYGELITTLAKMYQARCFYDENGRLNFLRARAQNIPSWYMHKGHKIRFRENDSRILSSVSKQISLDGINCVTVATDNTEGQVYSYTAKNTDPESPLNIYTAGQRYPDQPTRYICIGDTSQGDPEEKCRQYAEYLLMQHTANSVTSQFTSVLLPQLAADDLIELSGEDRLVTNISCDLNANTMQISCCNVAYLPKTYSLEVLT